MGPEELRVGDAERDQVTSALHEHFAQGRLTQDELEERLSIALAARTEGDLYQVTWDLPGSASPLAAATRVRPANAHRRRPPIPLLVIPLLLVSVALAGPWWAIFVVLRIFAVVFVITALMGFRRRRRGGARGGPPWGRQWGGPPWGGPPWGGQWDGAAQGRRAHWAQHGSTIDHY